MRAFGLYKAMQSSLAIFVTTSISGFFDEILLGDILKANGEDLLGKLSSFSSLMPDTASLSIESLMTYSFLLDTCIGLSKVILD